MSEPIETHTPTAVMTIDDAVRLNGHSRSWFQGEVRAGRLKNYRDAGQGRRIWLSCEAVAALPKKPQTPAAKLDIPYAAQIARQEMEDLAVIEEALGVDHPTAARCRNRLIGLVPDLLGIIEARADAGEV